MRVGILSVSFTNLPLHLVYKECDPKKLIKTHLLNERVYDQETNKQKSGLYEPLTHNLSPIIV